MEEKAMVIGENAGAMATIGNAENQQPPAIFGQEEGQRFYSSIVLDKNSENYRSIAAKVIKAMANPDKKLDEVANVMVLYVEHIVAHDVNIVDDSGLEVPAVRVVMVMENGQTVAGVSTGFKASLSNLMAIIGQPPYSPSLPLIVNRVKTRRNYNTFNIIMADETLKEVQKLDKFGKK